MYFCHAYLMTKVCTCMYVCTPEIDLKFFFFRLNHKKLRLKQKSRLNFFQAEDMMKIYCMVYAHNYKKMVQVAHGKRRERTSGRRNKPLKHITMYIAMLKRSIRMEVH